MTAVLQNLVNQPCRHAFVTEIESAVAPEGLGEETMRCAVWRDRDPQTVRDETSNIGH